MHLNLVSIIYRVKIEIFRLDNDELSLVVINNGFKKSIKLLKHENNMYSSVKELSLSEDDAISIGATEKIIEDFNKEKPTRRKHKKSISLYDGLGKVAT